MALYPYTLSESSSAYWFRITVGGEIFLRCRSREGKSATFRYTVGSFQIYKGREEVHVQTICGAVLKFMLPSNPRTEYLIGASGTDYHMVSEKEYMDGYAAKPVAASSSPSTLLLLL